MRPGCLLTPKDARVSSWKNTSLSHGTALWRSPPHACAGSDRAFRLNLASMVADSLKIRLLEGLSREDRIVVLGAAPTADSLVTPW